jgi:hypothetical protein
MTTTNKKTVLRGIDLREVANVGDTNSFNARYYADGKRISGEEYRSIKANAVRLECMTNVCVNGVQTFYSVARVAN